MVWSRVAIERACEAAEYIASDKPRAALEWLDGLFEVTDRLATLPFSGRLVPEIGLADYREIVYRRSHRIVYRVEKGRISILTVRNVAQRFDVREIDPCDE